MPLQFVTSQIANDAINADKINLASGTYDFSSGTATVRVNAPSNAADATTKNYVDNLVQGLHWKEACQLATAGALPACTYNNGAGTLTANANAALSVDGVAVDNGDRILVKNQTGGSPSIAVQNGIYTVTNKGAVGVPFVLTRASDMNEADEFAGSAVFIQEGTANSDAGFVCTNDGNPTLGTTNIDFVQFTGAGGLTGGNGIDITGNTIAVDLATGSGLEFQGGELQIAANGVTLEKNKMRWKYEDFNATSDEHTINKTTSDIPADFRAADAFFVARNGQTQRAEAGSGTPSDDNGFKVLVDGTALKIKLKSALVSGEILQVRYLHNL